MFLKFRKKKEKAPPRMVEGIDLTMSYCPQCETEYRSGVESCIECGVPLISGQKFLDRKHQLTAEFQSRSMIIDPADEMVTLRQAPVLDIKVLQRLLAAQRIPSILAGDGGPSCGRGCAAVLSLQIKKVDMEAAQQVLAEEFVKTTGVDLADLEKAEVAYEIHSEDVVCPACGCHFSPSLGACPDCGLSFG